MLVQSMKWSHPDDVHEKSGKQLDKLDITLEDM